MKKRLTIFADDSPEDLAALSRILQADAAYAAISDIFEHVFRPARKHGYSPDAGLGELTERDSEIIWKLEQMVIQILDEHGIDLQRAGF